MVIRICDPMAYKKHILLGKITKIHSYEGTVIIRLERYFSDIIPKIESVFIEIDGRPVPFFILLAEQPDNLTLRLRFSGYESDVKIKEFVGCNVYFTDPDIKFSKIEDPQYLIDYKVFSDDKVLIGTISEIIPNPGQLLLSIKTSSGKEILLPLHEDLINKIDTKTRVIQMIIPEGIADIN
jgi:16S rRNA processing protein RimM